MHAHSYGIINLNNYKKHETNTFLCMNTLFQTKLYNETELVNMQKITRKSPLKIGNY